MVEVKYKVQFFIEESQTPWSVRVVQNKEDINNIYIPKAMRPHVTRRKVWELRETLIYDEVMDG